MFVGTAELAMFGIVLGKLQYFLLRQQGYREKWWASMTLIAPFVAVIARLTTYALFASSERWLGLLINIPMSWRMPWDAIGEIITIAGGLGFGVTQWLVLRRRFHRAGWWMVATALGDVVFGFGNLGLSKAMYMYGVIEGAIKGVITGLTMIWLLRYSTRRVALA